jgi:hypothetical protein
LQDLAVVVLFMLIPLLAPDATGSGGGMGAIAQALGLAGVKAVVCITGIIAGACGHQPWAVCLAVHADQMHSSWDAHLPACAWRGGPGARLHRVRWLKHPAMCLPA